MGQPEPAPRNLEDLLIEHAPELERWLARRASGLLRYESVSDLIQGVHLKALSGNAGFEYRGPAEFQGFLRKIALAHVSNRHEYWKARKRDAGVLLRATSSDASISDGVAPVANQTSPSSFALRKERFSLAARAVAALPPRDQQIIDLMVDQCSIEDVAKALGISYEAAERARLRAVERFQKTLRLFMGER